jgi:molybdopterin converting factor small subunit
MVRVELLAGPLRERVGGRADVEVPWEGEGTLGELLARLFALFPALRAEALDGRGRLKIEYQLWLNGEMVRDGDGMARPVREGDRLAFLLPMSGG